MEHLVKFRLLSDTLTKSEFHALFTQLFDQYSKELFQSMILNHFHSQLSTKTSFNESAATIHDINAIISNILQSRECPPLNKKKKEDQCDDDKTEPIRLDSNSMLSMIGEIGSYLLLSEYTQLSLCNRSVFVASQSPFKLYRFAHLDKYLDHCNTTKQIVDLNKFRMIKELYIDNYQLTYTDEIVKQLLGIDAPLFRNIHTLRIKSAHQIHERDHLLNKMVASVVNSNQLRTVQLSAFGSNNALDAAAVWNFLEQHRNIECLVLPCTMTTEQSYRLSHHLRHTIKGLSMRLHTQSNISMLNTIGDQLLSLHCDYSGDSSVPLQLPNVKELCLHSVDDNIVTQLKWLGSSNLNKRLERISLVVWDIDDKGTIPAIEKFLLSHGSVLKYIFLKSLNYVNTKMFVAVITMLQTVLVQHEQRRESIKLQLRFLIPLNMQSRSEQLNTAKLDLTQLVHCMNTWTKKDFMLICHLQFLKVDDKSKTDLVEWIEQMSHEELYLVKHIVKKVHLERTTVKFVISNRNCAINGYQEKWIMNCHACDAISM
eukprot:609647_1